MSKKISKDDVTKALESFDKTYETLSKASESNIDQPEGADLGNPAKEKMSDAAKAFPPPAEKEEEGDEEGEKPPPFAKKAKKAFDADEDESDTHNDHSEKAKKSFAADMPEEVQTKIDVSEFLKSLVDHTGECIDGLAKSVSKSEARTTAKYDDLAKSLEDVQLSQAKIGIVLKAICQRIGIVENAPAAARKSEVVEKSGAQDRKFSSGLEGESQEPVFKSLSPNPTIAKSQISGVLCDLVRKGEADAMDVIGFETNGFIRPELTPKLKTALN